MIKTFRISFFKKMFKCPTGYWIVDCLKLGFSEIRVSNRNFLHENRPIIAQRFHYVSSQNCMKFRYNFALMCQSYFAQIMKEILVKFCYFVISSYFIQFEIQFQEMNESEIKAIISPTILRPALTCTFGGGLTSMVLSKLQFNFKSVYRGGGGKGWLVPPPRPLELRAITLFKSGTEE